MILWLKVPTVKVHFMEVLDRLAFVVGHAAVKLLHLPIHHS